VYGAIIVLWALWALAFKQLRPPTIAGITIVGLCLIIWGIHITPAMRLVRARTINPEQTTDVPHLGEHKLTSNVPH
jgi:hypothetical protein